MNNNKLFFIKYLFFLINYNFSSNNKIEEAKVDIKINFLSNFRSFFSNFLFEKIKKKNLIEKSFYLGGFLFINYKLNSILDINKEIKLKLEKLNNETENFKKESNKKDNRIKNIEKITNEMNLKINNFDSVKHLSDAVNNVSNAFKSVSNTNDSIIKILTNSLRIPFYGYGMPKNNNFLLNKRLL